MMIVKNKLLMTLLSVALASFVISPVFAEQMSGHKKMSQSKSTPVAYESEKLIGQEVINQQGEKIGVIRNLAIDNNGEITYAVLGVGGFAGMKETDVAVPFKQLRISPDQKLITLNVSRDRVTSEFAAFEDVREGQTMMHEEKRMEMQQEMERGMESQ